MSPFRVLCVILILLCATFVSCRTAPIRNIPDNDIPTMQGMALTQEELETSIIRGGNKLGWTMRKMEPGLIVGTIYVRSHEAQVNIRYNDKSWNITYRSSNNLKSNGETIHSNYNSWVNNLANSIRNQINETIQFRGAEKK
ncbi:MAG: hypothetical protein AB9872_04285 [Solidesulfovibrio sp.]